MCQTQMSTFGIGQTEMDKQQWKQQKLYQIDVPCHVQQAL